MGDWIILYPGLISPLLVKYFTWDLISKETRSSFKKWPLNLWMISSKTIMEVENITRCYFKKFSSPKL